MHDPQKFDLVLRDAALAGQPGLHAVGVQGGRIAAIAADLPAGRIDEKLGGALLTSGFVDTHVHLDKSCLSGCCAPGGGLKGAIAAVAALKRSFTEADVYARGARTLEKAILQGTTHMRTHVEVDPRVGLRSFAAIRRLKADYAFAIDLSICVFPQEGLTNDPGAETLILEALDQGADLLGGCPYTDSDPQAQIDWLFAIAQERDLDLDLHLDFDLDPEGSLLGAVCRATDAHGWGGRVAAGHATKLSAIDPGALAERARQLAGAGIAITALPATDLYLNGRDRDFDRPRGIAPVHWLAERGVTASIATNNVLNPFTPFGDCSLLRMANLYANAMHVGPEGFDMCFDLITGGAARLMNRADYGIAVGSPADLVVLDAASPGEALAEIAVPLAAYKNGRRSFRRDRPFIERP
jgi:cytosine deaminase